MADGNQLAQAYSILGQATTAEYKRRRKEEKEYEKRMMRNQILGYLAQPLLKTAGEAIGEGVTDLIRSPFEKKYEEFLESEEFLKRQSKQQSSFNLSKDIISKDDEALKNPQGRDYHYTRQRYNLILEEFKRTNPEEEYKEGVNGVFWNQAEEWWNKTKPLVDSQVEAARKIRSPEDVSAAYKEAYRPRNLGSILADGVRKMFNKKTIADIRQERLEYLASVSDTNREALLDATKALGESTVKQVAEAAQKLDTYRKDMDSFEITNTEEKVMPFPVAGRSYSKRLMVQTLKNKRGVEVKRIRNLDGSPIQGPIKLGKYIEAKELETPDGRVIKWDVEYNVTEDGLVVAKDGKPTIQPASPTSAAARASEGQLRMASNIADRVSRTFPLSNNQTPKQSNIYKIFMEGPEPKKIEDDQLDSSFRDMTIGYATTLTTIKDGVTGLNEDEAYPIAAAMIYRNLDGMIDTKEGAYLGQIWRDTDIEDFSDFNLEKSNGLSNDTVQKAGSVYALDAFYALEGTGSEITISNNSLDMLMDSAKKQFPILSFQKRERLLESLSSFDALNEPRYGLDKDMSYIDMLTIIHKNVRN